MRYRIVFVLMIVHHICMAQAKDSILYFPTYGKIDSDFVPTGYDLFTTAAGDLDGDKISDLVLIVEKRLWDDTIQLPENSLPERVLLVLLKTGDRYKLVSKSETVIFGRESAGGWGDPFAEMKIENGVLIVSQAKLTGAAFSCTRKFRYQNKDMYFIGLTSGGWDSNNQCPDGFANSDYEDINFVTGSRYRKKISSNCKVLMDKKDKITPKPLVKLDDFIGEYTESYR
jgi:hypothetical protein